MTATAARDALARLDERAAAAGVALERDVRLAPYTTLRVGGPADRLVTVRTRDELRVALRIGLESEIPTVVLGNGSDVVVADAGIRGLVIRNRAREVAVDDTLVTADSGAAMAMLVRRCAEEALTGLEFGISVPGTLGGAVWANAGAHGGEMKDVVVDVDVLDPRDGSERRLSSAECAFAYRESRFKASDELILGATLRLRRGSRPEIEAAIRANQEARVATQPLADQNAGSVFRNPADDHAGRLIEAAGLKGLRIGTARVSEKHANFIVTDGGGRAADVRALGDRVRGEVVRRFGVDLRYEIEFIGDWGTDGGGQT